MENKKLVYGIVAVCVAAIIVSGVVLYGLKSQKEPATIANPTSVYCIEQGSELEL